MPPNRLSIGAAAAAVVAPVACVIAVACSAFDLGDVVGDGSAGSTDGSSTDGGGSDANQNADGPGPCVPGGDPCNCLDPPLTISAPPHGTGQAIMVIGSTVYFVVTDFGSSSPIVFGAPSGGIQDGGAAIAVTKPAPVAPSPVAGGGWFFFRHTAAPAGISQADISATNGDVTAYWSPLTRLPGNLAIDSKHVFFGGNDGAMCAIPIQDDAGPVGSDDAGCGNLPLVPPRAGGPSTFQVAANDTAVFEMYSSHIYSAPQATGVISQLIAHPGSSLDGITDDHGSLFWTEVNDGGSIWSATDDGGNVSDIVPVALDGLSSNATIAVDADGIYWSQANYTKIWSAARDGSKRTLLACDPSGVPAIATDASFVYWLTTNGGVRRIAKQR